MNAIALARRGTMRAAQKRTPAAIALAEAMKKPGRFPVAPKEARTLDGVVFASKGEMKRYAHLKIREKLGEITDLVLQPAWPVEINGVYFTTYTADFAYFDHRLSRRVIEDVKSAGGTDKDPAFKLRRKAAQLAHGIVVTEVVT